MGRILRRDAPARKRALLHGAAAEDIALRFLERRGLKLLERNFRVRGGEIDLICRDGEWVVFVEVRLRTNATYGGAGASIDARKQARLVVAARHWLVRHGDLSCRFDCVLLDKLDEAGVTWIRDAFSTD